jgi:hypothetical protein
VTAAVARELSIVYGSLTVGGTSDYLLDGSIKIRQSVEYQSASVTFLVTYAGAASEAAFAAAVAAVETAFSTPRQRLQVLQGSTTLADYDPSQNTGFNAAPRARKLAGPSDTGRSRTWEVTIDVDRPASLSGQGGRREATVNVERSPSRRRLVTFSGTYTALGSNGARAQYEASIDAYVATVLVSLGGTYELVNEPQAVADDTDKVLDYTRQYREILLAQSAAATNDADLVESRLSWTRVRVAPGDSRVRGVLPSRLQELVVHYDAWVLGTTDLRSKWEGTVRPWVLQHALSASGASAGAIVYEDPGLDYSDRKIGATLRVLAVFGGALLEGSVVTRETRDLGLAPASVWGQSAHSRYMFQGPATSLRTVATTTRELGSSAQAARGGAAPNGFGVFNINPAARGDGSGFPPRFETGSAAGFVAAGGRSGESADVGGDSAASAGGGSWVLIDTDTTSHPVTIGLAGEQLDTIETSTVDRYLWVVPAKPDARPAARAIGSDAGRDGPPAIDPLQQAGGRVG